MEKKKDKILICGAFDFKGLSTGGQPVKTRELYYALQKTVGADRVIYVETVGWKKNPFATVMRFFQQASKAKYIIMLPAHKGVAVFSRLLVWAKKFWGCTIYYDVVGGWLVDKVKNDNRLMKLLCQFDGIWVETTIMNTELEKSGLTNTRVVRNFKKLNPIDLTKLPQQRSRILKACFFSRVTKQKGVIEAIEAIKEVNQTMGSCVELDIYGPIDPNFTQEFSEVKNNFPNAIHYRGVVQPNQSVETLKKYDVLLFPTLFKTEGLPGTIIDAYAAGLPVISSRWDSFGDIVDESKTGIGYTFDNFDELVECLKWAVTHRENLDTMRANCVEKAKEFMPETVVSELIKNGLIG